jgi:hypothetical protein
MDFSDVKQDAVGAGFEIKGLIDLTGIDYQTGGFSVFTGVLQNFPHVVGELDYLSSGIGDANGNQIEAKYNPVTDRMILLDDQGDELTNNTTLPDATIVPVFAKFR